MGAQTLSISEETEQDLTSPISKALVVLDAVAMAESPPRFVELLNALPLSRATLHRQLRQLVKEGMLVHDEVHQTYSIGMRVLRLAHSAWSRASLASVARDTLDTLSTQIPETIHLAVLDNNQVLYVDKRLPPRSVSMFSSPGKIGPAYCTGVGKAMLSALPEARLAEAIKAQSFQRHTDKTLVNETMLRDELARIRERGHAYDDEEHEGTIICVALPILNKRGEPIGALSVTSTTYVTSLDTMVETYLPAMKAATNEISENAQIALGV
ncbi:MULTISPECIES: IclR family transcriptional regulator [unclassified Pseudovibrio]|uniref:IclR family transcriptional regulator n=1 Tax=unclassified Pseudovibrio TaxID=2627060 RepID=UPI0007AE3A70|nr:MULTISPECIES: IclR family transcriptional regulator [unclassified Pseudovibrio]KZK92354.1 Transcriptional regulator KdgR [Pseudovibrio sp. W74]KZL11049.1 Transcriptional regulator KdgR [Pseudovibrio sp. Ad14]